jgi:hypothetical protein
MYINKPPTNEKPPAHFTMIGFANGLIAVALIASIVPEKVQALVTTNQIGDGAMTTKKGQMAPLRHQN